MEIVKVSDEQYRITDGKNHINFSREKFEDLYYAVPLNPTYFLRLLQDNICQNAQQRHLLNAMLENAGAEILDQLQKQIAEIQL